MKKGKKPKTTKPKPKTEGQRQLIAVKGSDAVLCKAIGCGEAIVGHWRRGRRIPGGEHRHKLELLFGIPQRAWDVVPGADVTKSAPSKKKSAGNEDTLEITKRQIDDVLEQLEDKKLTDTAAARFRDTAAKLLALRARLERDQEMLEDRAVREHPEWKRLRTNILKALEPYPEAALAVAEAIDDSN